MKTPKRTCPKLFAALVMGAASVSMLTTCAEEAPPPTPPADVLDAAAETTPTEDLDAVDAAAETAAPEDVGCVEECPPDALCDKPCCCVEGVLEALSCIDGAWGCPAGARHVYDWGPCEESLGSGCPDPWP